MLTDGIENKMSSRKTLQQKAEIKQRYCKYCTPYPVLCTYYSVDFLKLSKVSDLLIMLLLGSRLLRPRLDWNHIVIAFSCRSASTTSVIISDARRDSSSSNCNSTSIRSLLSRRLSIVPSTSSISITASSSSSSTSSNRRYNLIQSFDYTSIARIYGSGVFSSGGNGEDGSPPLVSVVHPTESSSSSSMESASSPTQRSRLRVSDILGLMEPKAFTIAETCTVLEGVSHLIKEKLASSLTGSSSTFATTTTVCAM